MNEWVDGGTVDGRAPARTRGRSVVLTQQTERNKRRQARSSPGSPPRCRPRGGLREAGLGGPASPSQLPSRPPGPRGRTKRAAPIGCSAPRRRTPWASAANRCIEMQISSYKRGGAAVGRKPRGARAAGLVLLGGGEAVAGAGTPVPSAPCPCRAPSGTGMAPPSAPGPDRVGREDEDYWETRGDRKVRAGAVGERAGRRPCGAGTHARKPLVEKKRRARINDSLQELRLLLAGAQVRRPGGRPGAAGLAGGSRSARLVQAKLENAEVLELTVRRVQGALRGRARVAAGRAGTRAAGACHPHWTEDFPSRRLCPVGGEGSPRSRVRPRVSWVSRVPAGRVGWATQSPLTARDAALSLPPSGPEREQLQAEASERFAAGYIQCMHEVHTFVSTCQAIDATVAAELLNHLLESMPLREGSSFQDLLGDALAGPPGAPGRSGWPVGGAPGSPIPSLPGPGDDLCSDLEEAPEAELSRAPAEGPDLVPAALGSLTAAQIAQSVWRPW
ncbi:LOW QUALITY PROTEIN: Transcription cofactor HES-6 [Plecturocebus cupreus]